MTRTLFALLLVAGLSTGFAHAQTFEDLLAREAGGSFIRYAEPGDITIQVSVWGNTNAGLWEVTQGTHLSTLFTLAGGPSITTGESSAARLGAGNGRIIGKIKLRLVRKQQGEWVTFLEETMQDGLAPLKEDPVLEDGDMVLVELEVRRTLGWRDALSILGSIGSTVFLVDSLVRLARGGR